MYFASAKPIVYSIYLKLLLNCKLNGQWFVVSRSKMLCVGYVICEFFLFVFATLDNERVLLFYLK